MPSTFRSVHTVGAIACLVALTAATCLRPPAVAAEGGRDVADLSLQELMDLEVTSVLRKPERRTQAAVYVFAPA